MGNRRRKDKQKNKRKGKNNASSTPNPPDSNPKPTTYASLKRQCTELRRKINFRLARDKRTWDEKIWDEPIVRKYKRVVEKLEQMQRNRPARPDNLEVPVPSNQGCQNCEITQETNNTEPAQPNSS